MAALLLNYYLMPFNVSLLALVLLSMAETIGMQFGFRPSDLLKRFIPVWISNSPLFDVKFSKVLIFVFLLMNFSFAGYFLQFVYFANQQQLISPFYIILPALIIAIFFTMFMIHCLDQVIKPKLNQKIPACWGDWQRSLVVAQDQGFQPRPESEMSLDSYIMYRLSQNLVNWNFSHR